MPLVCRDRVANWARMGVGQRRRYDQQRQTAAGDTAGAAVIKAPQSFKLSHLVEGIQGCQQSQRRGGGGGVCVCKLE